MKSRKRRIELGIKDLYKANSTVSPHITHATVSRNIQQKLKAALNLPLAPRLT